MENYKRDAFLRLEQEVYDEVFTQTLHRSMSFRSVEIADLWALRVIVAEATYSEKL